MIRERLIAVVLTGVTSCGVLCGAARGQAEIEALLWDRSMTGAAGQAIFELGYTQQGVVNESGFIQMMRRQSWDLVVWDLPFAFIFEPETTLQLLEDHVAGGGRALINYNNLDGWPELQALLGVQGTKTFPHAHGNILVGTSAHPAWPNSALGVTGAFTYADGGDELIPAPGSEVGAIFEQNGSAAVVVANWGRTITNGFDWDTYSAPSAFPMAEMEYVMCRADLDRSTGAGVLDIFDFLAFQDAFIRQEPVANLRFDEVFDIFDFLAFQKAFVNGCD